MWKAAMGVVLVLFGLSLGVWEWKRRRRQAVLKRPFPAEWLKLLEERVPFYMPLSSDERRDVPAEVFSSLADQYCRFLVFVDL